MIYSNHKKWAMLIFDFYIERLLKANFSGFSMINEMPVIGADTPLLVTPNHFSWWDGFFIDYVFKKLTNRKLYMMMTEEQLSKYYFFSKVGAYSINPVNPKSIIESFRFTREKLLEPNSYVVVYPQGEIEPYEKRPFNLKPGIVKILFDIEKSVKLLPVGFRINYGNEKHPEVFVRFGNPIDSKIVCKNFDSFNAVFAENMSLLDSSISNNHKKDFFE